MARYRIGGRRRPLAIAAWVLVVTSAAFGGGAVQAAGCARSDFEAVVGRAASTLRDLQQRNAPNFQGKLRALKEKRGWTHEQFMKEAAPFVQDAKITEFDAKSEELFSRISEMGQEGASATTPDCSMLEKLNGIMQGLVDTQQAKWTYMLGKIDVELAR